MYHIQPGVARAPQALAAAGERIGAWVGAGTGLAREAFLAERDRWPLWLPVLQGFGIALYFALGTEPPLWLGLAGAALALACGLAARNRAGILLLAVAAGVVAVGFTSAQWRTAWVAAPVLQERLGPVSVEGRLRDLEARPDGGLRLTLDRLAIERLDAADTPARARLTVRGTAMPAPTVGDRVRLLGMLMPPPGPAAPGAFDFARRAYFHRLGAVGYGLGRLEVVATAAEARTGGLATWINGLRRGISSRVRASLDGAAGTVAAALMVGDTRAIPEEVLADFRDSGLAHLLAVSGLNFGLLAGVIFGAVRLGLAAVPAVALRCPIKKWAALAAIAGACAYLLVTPPTPPTQRAFLMLSVAMLAVLVDRSPLSPPLVAWAAGAILLLAPESLLSVSFQMSFAAVLALVAAYEGMRERLRDWRSEAGLARRAGLYLGMVAATTVIAGLATMPFALHHFNRIVAFGLAANLVAVPLTAIWIMPWAVAAFALMPFGAEALALVPMGWGIDAVIATAATVADWPGAAILVPATPLWGLAVASLGGLWLCLWRGRWRWLGPLAIAGAAACAFVRPPDVWVDADARMVAVRGDDGALFIAPPRRSGNFVAESWLRRAGAAQPARDPARLRCDPLGCVHRGARAVVAFALDGRALMDDCRAADIVIAAVPIRRGCPSAGLALGWFDIWRGGAHAIWLDADGRPVRVESVADRRGERPWTRRR